MHNINVSHVHDENTLLLRRRGKFKDGTGVISAPGRATGTCDPVCSIQYANQMTSGGLSAFVATADLVQVTGDVVACGKGWAQWLEVGDRSFFFDLSHDERAKSRKILLVTPRFHDAIICDWKMRTRDSIK